MSISRIIGVLIGLVFSFFSIVLAYGFVGWGWSDSGTHWSIGWTLALIPWSLPFWFSFWIVYRCLGSNLKYAILAELGVVVDFAVEDDVDGAPPRVFVGHGLVAAFTVDDGEAAVDEGGGGVGAGVDEGAVAVGSAVGEGVGHGGEGRRVRGRSGLEFDDAGDSAHISRV